MNRDVTGLSLILTLAGLLTFSPARLNGADIYWRINTGWFQTAANWEGGVVPGPDDTPCWTNLLLNTELFWNADTVTANARFSRDSGQTAIQVKVGEGRTYTVTNLMVTGDGGAGAHVTTMHTGTLAVTNAEGTATLKLRLLEGSSPNLLYGGTLIVDHLIGDTNAPWGRPHQLYLSHGALIVRNDSQLYLDSASGNNIYVGQYGPAQFRFTGGTNVLPSLQIGYNNIGEWVVEGPETRVTIPGGGPKYAGSRCIVSNGAQIAASGISMSGPSNLWLVTGPGSRVDVKGQIYSSTGAGAFSHFRIEEGGVMTAGTQTYLGSSANAGPVTMTIDGIGSRFEAGSNFEVGDQARSIGYLFITNGGELRSISTLYVGESLGGAGTGTVLVASGGILDCSTLHSGKNDSGTITSQGGIFQFRTKTPTVTTNTPGSIVVEDGTVAFRNLSDVSVKGNWSGTQVANILFRGHNAFRLNTATNTTTGQAYTFDTGLGATNYCRLEMVNGGTMYRGGAVTIGGGGSLLMSNTVATLAETLTSEGVVTLCNATGVFNQAYANHGRLEGGGTVSGTVTNFAGSVVAPGGTNGTGALTVSGAFGLMSGATLACEIDGIDRYDGLVLSSGSTLDLGGCDLVASLGFAPEAGASFTLIDNQGGNLLGTFAAKGDSVVYEGRPYRLNVQYGAGDGDDVVLTVVPQGTLMILK